MKFYPWTLPLLLLICTSSHAHRADVKTIYHTPYMNSADPDLGHSPLPLSVGQVEKRHQDDVIYSVEYRFDKYGRRISNSTSSHEKKFFALFLGGSNTFGEGLSAKETIPEKFEQIAPDFKSYNYSFQGYGLNHVLVQLEKLNFAEQMAEKRGYAFYHYFYFHRHRLLGTARYFSWSKGRAPSFVLNQNQLIHKGLFAESRPFYFGFLKLLNWSQVLQWLGKDFPNVYSDYSNRLLCSSLLEAKSLFNQKFPESEFVVVIGMRNTEEETVVEKCLKPRSISYIDLRSVYPKDKKNYRIQFGIEDHNNGKANQLIAENIYQWVLRKQRSTH